MKNTKLLIFEKSKTISTIGYFIVLFVKK